MVAFEEFCKPYNLIEMELRLIVQHSEQDQARTVRTTMKVLERERERDEI